MGYGFVYVIGHELMEGIYKIGMTSHPPLRRRDELSSGTAIPLPFDLLFYIEVENPAEVESSMHDTFSDFRVSENREFFRTDLDRIFKEFERFKEEASAPLAITYVGEGYLVADAENNKLSEMRISGFMERAQMGVAEAIGSGIGNEQAIGGA